MVGAGTGAAAGTGAGTGAGAAVVDPGLVTEAVVVVCPEPLDEREHPVRASDAPEPSAMASASGMTRRVDSLKATLSQGMKARLDPSQLPAASHPSRRNAPGRFP